MPRNDCCSTCCHCGPGQNPAEGWCRLRQLTVTRDLAKFAFCHHWTQKSPSLPSVQEHFSSPIIERQLDLGRSFSSSSKEDEFSMI
ncbi:metal-binding protein [Prochlorococcus sp. MIT 1341]|uniref:metal-binding protein n=1 Tax=Prochlorococcus sp. MIT 1341 TaxID=3096221 RepID=UPI002A7559BE|nr:metal-binding protein [Prochlorococcus sp. MIT 1341]